MVYSPTGSLLVPITRYTPFRIVQVMTSTVSASCIEPLGSLPAPHQSHEDNIQHDKVELDTDQYFHPMGPHRKEANVPPLGPSLGVPGNHGNPQNWGF